jgi:hypothetical protein
LESDLLLRVTGGEPASWRVPVAGAREITATLDGRPVPIFVEAEGREAVLALPGPGSFRIQLRRTASVARGGSEESLDFAVNALPSARLIVQPPPRSRPALLINARGSLSSGPEGVLEAELGPVDRVVIRWKAPATAAARPPAGAFDLIALWDIEPAGDLVRARFTYRGPSGQSMLRFQLEPGMLARSVSVPGLVDSSWANVDGQPVWTGQVDPPLSEGSVVQLDLWRPCLSSPREEKPGAGGGQGVVADDEFTRRLPRVTPLDIVRRPGSLGVRRPSHWTGRLEPVEGLEPLNDESFVRAWGSLPDSRLTLSGTTRLRPDDLPRFRTGPATTRITVKPTLNLAIEPGRINLEYEAELSDLDATLHQLEMAIPEDLVVLSVTSEGLTDWNIRSARRLMLRYDRPIFRPRRRLSIAGWVPVAGDPLKVGPQMQQVPTPWIHVPGMEELPGSLVISSATRVETIGATGTAVVSTALPPGANATDSRTQQTLRVDDPRKLGTLRWSVIPPRVNVQIESQLIIHTDSVEWVAVLGYSVQGGAIDSIHLKLPSAWALNSQIELAGNDYRKRSDTLGPVTFWRLALTRPVWGSQRLVLRSALPANPGQEVQHPEITPLGRGRSDTYLGLVYASESTLTAAGSSGLQRIAYGSRFQDEEFRHATGTQDRAYHVEHDNWSLKVQVPTAPDDARAPSLESARVLWADLHLAVMPDRSLLGQAVYETQPRTGRFLVVELPRNGDLLWATVDQGQVRPLRSADQRWFIPLAEQGPSRVSLFWSTPMAIAETGGSTWSLDLPRAGAGRASTTVRLHLPEPLALGTSSGSLEVTGPDRVDLEHADRIVRLINEFIAQMDPGSGRDRERITSFLIAHEMHLRGAERSLKASSRGGDRARKERAERDLEVIQSTRKAVAESVQAAARDEELNAAKNYLGLSSNPAGQSMVAVPEPTSPDRIRSQGRPAFLIGLGPGLDEPTTSLSGTFASRVGPAEETPDRARAMLMLGFTVALGLAGASSHRPGRARYLMVAGFIGLLGVVGGPFVLASGLALLAAGWLSRPGTARQVNEDRAGSGLTPHPA